jgi:hypothetical protein
VKLIHAADNKPVPGAIIVQSRADMSPIGMGAMSAPMTAMPASEPGVYTFKIANRAVWKKADKWLLSFAAKVQGEAQTVHGNLIVTLAP